MAADGSWTRNEVLTVMSHPIRELDGRIFGVVGWGEDWRAAAARGSSDDPRMRPG